MTRPDSDAPITLHGRKVRLREFASTDLDAVHAIVGDPAVTDWLSFDTRDMTQASVMLAGIIERTAQRPRLEYYLAVTVPREGTAIGFARLGLDGVNAAKLGYAIRADHWGHGYATDAAHTMISFGFQQLGLHRISAAIGPDNAASVAVVTRLGMQHEGRIRDHVHTNGAWRDSLLYSILEHEHRVLSQGS